MPRGKRIALIAHDNRKAEMVERVAGLQTQYAPSGYVGLWTRVRDFRREELTRLMQERQVVRATLMRATLHLMRRGRAGRN